MNVRSAVAAFLLVLASSACSASRPAAQPPAQGAAEAAPKAVCREDKDCSPYHSCNSDGHCRCDVDADCAASQACRAGICLPR